MKTWSLLAWALTVLGTCILAAVMVALIILSVAVMATLSVAAMPVELLIKVGSLFSPRFDAWTTSAYARLSRQFRATDSGPLTS